MGAITPEGLEEGLYSVHEEVMNKGNPDTLDRSDMPWWTFLNGQKKAMSFTQGKTIVKVKKNGGLKLQFWNNGYQTLGFKRNRINSEMEFAPGRTHLGQEIEHTELEDQGYTINPNETGRGKNFANSLSMAEQDKLVDIFKELIEDASDTYDVEHDLNFHLDGTQDPDAFIGLDGLLPLNHLGTIGGQSRTDKCFQHQLQLGLSTAASGNFERGLNRLIRDSNNTNRGMRSKIDFILAGDDFIDGYVAWARANNVPYQRVGGPAKVARMDIATPDEAIHYQGIPIIRDPTFRVLDEMFPGLTTPWSKRAYFLASRTWTLGFQQGKDKHFSVPADPFDNRLTRASYDGRYVLILRKPAGNGVASVA